jgi:uncharacterized protein (DUF885 family)
VGPALPPARRATPLDAVADGYVRTLAALDPIAATAMGLPGHQAELPDLSPAGHAARADAARAVLRTLAAIEPVDAVDDVTLAAMRERLGLDVELAEAGEPERGLNVIASPLQAVRDVFDLMPATTLEDWATIAARLAAVPGALAGYAASLRAAGAVGHLPAIRQVRAGIAQATEAAAPGTSPFTRLVASARVAGRRLADADPTLAAALHEAAAAARRGYDDLAGVLRAELAPRAPAHDGVGRDRHALWSRAALGTRVDPDESYAWGLEELARVAAEQRRVAEAVAGPGATVAHAVALLDADPARTLHGTEALRAWMQETADGAIAALAETHFDIPAPVRRLECLIAPTHTGGIYYTQPSADFARPGRMWWAVPEEVTEFGTWRERTTVYHEGVPGHHLQVGQAVYRADVLNDWRRLACWVSGHGEGWALYAEQLMANLGFLDDPGDRLGMLDALRLRAARVVLDIGVHLGARCPPAWGGGVWDARKAWAFLVGNANLPEAFLRFELDRYLGWPAQATSYLIGRRLWEQARDDSAARARAAGEAFDLRAFHRRALDLGSVGLDVLYAALAADPGRPGAVRPGPPSPAGPA